MPAPDAQTTATIDRFPGPLPEYRARRSAGRLKADPMQQLAAEKLQSLHRALLNYQPQPPATPGGWFARLLAQTPPPPPARPKGLYLFGGVGRGKSMLMDLFFETSAVRHRRRVHFHAFMQEVQERLHALRAGETDPLIAVARALADEAWLLCFDEFVVTDIADAMILGRLFEALFQAGVIVVATSNRPPDELYPGGLHRDRFLPFIALLKEELDVLELDNGRDYRLSGLIGKPVYLTPADDAAAASLERMFAQLTDGIRPEPLDLEVRQRRLRVARQATGTAFFEFRELCTAALGPADYLAIAARFETIVLANVPLLGPERADEARRFNTMIDTFYEAHVHLVISAAAAPEFLYTDGEGAFEFQRTVSRLMEMQSIDYLSTRRRDGGGNLAITAPRLEDAMVSR